MYDDLIWKQIRGAIHYYMYAYDNGLCIRETTLLDV